MVNCPTCGHPVPDTQRFCGNCGSDVRAALAAATPPGTPIGEGETAAYAYAQPAGYGYEQQPLAESPRAASRMVIIAAVLILAACCAFACGILIGFEASPVLLPGGTPAATPRPTRESLLPILLLFGLA